MEEKVKKLLIQGKTQRQIATDLGISQSKVSRIAKRLNQSESSTESKAKKVNQTESKASKNKGKTKQDKKINNESKSVLNKLNKKTSESNNTDNTENLPFSSLTVSERDAIKNTVAELAARGYPIRSIKNTLLDSYKIDVSHGTVHTLIHECNIAEIRKEVFHLVINGVPDLPLASVGVRQELLQQQLASHQAIIDDAIAEQKAYKPKLEQAETELNQVRRQAQNSGAEELEELNIVARLLTSKRREYEQSLNTARVRENKAYNDVLRIIELADKNMTNWSNVMLKRQEIDSKLGTSEQEAEDTATKWDTIAVKYEVLVNKENEEQDMNALLEEHDQGWQG